MKKLLIATLAVFFFIGMVQADDEPVEPEVIEEVIEEVLEEPTAEPTEEVIEEVVIEEVVDELVIEELIIDEVVGENAEENEMEESCFLTNTEYDYCRITYQAINGGDVLTIRKTTTCYFSCAENAHSITSEVVATYVSFMEFYGD